MSSALYIYTFHEAVARAVEVRKASAARGVYIPCKLPKTINLLVIKDESLARAIEMSVAVCKASRSLTN